jgi:hypothetical protein
MKGMVRNKHFHIRGIKENQMLMEPSLNRENLLQAEVKDLMSEMRESNVWIAYFEERKIVQEQTQKQYTDPDEGSEWEEVEMTTLKDITAANAAYRTPYKLKIGDFIATAADSVTMGPPMDARAFVKVETVEFDANEPTQENMSKGLLDMLKQWNVLVNNLAAIHGNLAGTNKRDVRFKEDLVDTFLRVEAKIKETDPRMKLLISGVGADSTASERGSNSVWKCIKGLQEDIVALEQQMTLRYERLSGGGNYSQKIEKLELARDLGSKRLRGLEDQEMAHGAKLEQLDVNVKALYEHYGKSMEDVSGAIRKLNNGRRVQEVQFGNSTSEERDAGKLRRDHERLRVIVQDMQTGQKESTGGSVSGWQPEFENLKRKLADLGGNPGQMFTHKRLTFRTKQDVKLWVVTNAVLSPGMYWDLFSALVCMKPKTQTGRERADESYSASRTHTTPLENELLGSMSHLRPALLFEKTKGVLAAMEEGFGACLSHAAWLGSGLDSYSTLMTNHLTEFIDSVTGMLDLCGDQGPEHDFARELLDKIDKA